MAKRCRDERACEEIRCFGANQDLNLQECARKLAEYNSEIIDDDFEAEQLLHISCLRSTSRESQLRQQLNRKPEDKMEDLDVNTLMWEC